MPFQTPIPPTPPLEERPAGENLTTSNSVDATVSKPPEAMDWQKLLWPDPQPPAPPVLTRLEVEQMLQQVLATVRMLPPLAAGDLPPAAAVIPAGPKVAADSALLSVSFAFYVAEGAVFEHHVDIPFPGFRLETMWPINLRSVGSALHGAVNVPVQGAVTEYLETMRENCGRPERPLKLTPGQERDEQGTNEDNRSPLEMV